MGTEYALAHDEYGNAFDLGKGPWCRLRDHGSKFVKLESREWILKFLLDCLEDGYSGFSVVYIERLSRKLWAFVEAHPGDLRLIHDDGGDHWTNDVLDYYEDLGSSTWDNLYWQVDSRYEDREPSGPKPHGPIPKNKPLRHKFGTASSTSVMRYMVGFPSVLLVPGESVVTRVMVPFGSRLKRLIIPSRIAPRLRIIDLRVERTRILLDEVPASLFAETNMVDVEYPFRAGEVVTLRAKSDAIPRNGASWKTLLRRVSYYGGRKAKSALATLERHSIEFQAALVIEGENP